MKQHKIHIITNSIKLFQTQLNSGMLKTAKFLFGNNRLKWTKWTKLDQMDQVEPNGLNWTEVDLIDRSRPKGPNGLDLRDQSGPNGAKGPNGLKCT